MIAIDGAGNGFMLGADSGDAVGIIDGRTDPNADGAADGTRLSSIARRGAPVSEVKTGASRTAVPSMIAAETRARITTRAR